MKDFDAERTLDDERQEFRFGGETFALRRVVPIAALRALKTDDTVSDWSSWVDVMLSVALKAIDPDDNAHARFVALIENDDSPVGYPDLQRLSGWLVEQATSVPTNAPSPSTPGRETTGTPSTDGSSSQAVVALTL